MSNWLCLEIQNWTKAIPWGTPQENLLSQYILCVFLYHSIESNRDLEYTQLLRFYFSRMNHFIFTNSYHHIHLRPLWSYNTTITTQTTILYLVRGNKSRKIANKALFSNICNNGCCFHWNAFRSAWCNESLSVRRWPLEDGSRAGCRYRLSVVNFGL